MYFTYSHDTNGCTIHECSGPHAYTGALNPLDKDALETLVIALAGELPSDVFYNCVRFTMKYQQQKAMRKAREAQQAAAIDASGEDPRVDA